MLSNALHGPRKLDAWRSLATLASCAAVGLLGVSQPTSAADGKFVNLSTRALVGTGEEVMIGGFIIEEGSRQLLIQAIGPELANAGISNALADPVLTVINTTDPGNPVEFMVNDNWEDSQGQLVSDLWGGNPNLTAGSLSSAAVLTLDPGNYTAKVEGKDGTAGVAIVEVYDIDASDADGKFVNISTRALVEIGDEVMIGGFIIEEGSREVLIQAKGPELANDGIANVLADPVLTVINTTNRNNHIELLVNDNWEDTQGQLVSDLWGGNPNLTAGSLSSAAVLTLEPGNYTAKVEGKDGTTGVAIVEVYEIDSPDTGSPDREALVALYNATDGANWTRSNNWGTNEPLGDWEGVRTDATTGRMVSLDLAGNNLTGPIPPELGNLANLEWLSLHENQLSGPIPGELGNLANLERLYLHENQLSGPIPGELGNLSNLRFLYLYDNQLSGPIPVGLGNLANLEGLGLYDNQLTGPIPAELGNLSNLRWLRLSENQLSGPIPAELGGLANLQFLFLHNNNLTGPIPAELGNLASLKRLWLDDNQLSGPIPVGLSDLSNLYSLRLSSNQLSGPIPGELGNLSNLRILYLGGNQLSGPIPGELGNLAILYTVYLRGNQFSGCIPNELRDVARGDLSKLGLPYCGTIASDRAALVALYNATDGPNWTNSANWLTDAPLGEWQGVTTDATTGRVVGLSLAGNNLTGPIPPELAYLGNVLLVLDLSDNQLRGPLSADLGNLANLEAIFLGGNKFAGCIPNGLWDVVEGDLSTLGLQDCGTISSDRAALVALYNATDGPNWINSANWLTDAPLGDWERVVTDAFSGRVVGLNLSENNLTGPIPAELGNLANLELLNLRDNQFSGPIPAELGNLANLESLYLYNNQLSGPIPAELGYLPHLEDIFLGGNQISGCIPNGLRDVAEGDLSMLGLPYCGTISNDRAALVALYKLTDGEDWTNSVNWLTDAPLGDWEGVTTDAITGRVVGLDLAGNNLIGPIPPELGELAYLEAIFLGGNQLSGCIPNWLLELPEGDLSTLGLQDCGTIASDRAALVALYNATDGENWDYGFRWLTDAPLGLWEGVRTYASTGRVVVLDLSRNNLIGPIPAELGRLTSLEWLYLRDNQLSGPIPAELGNLSNLERLWLSSNQLSGPIPAELGNLANLKELRLYDNQLSGPIPAELGNLANLKELRLYDNQLGGPIPAELGNLANLERLWLSSNQLSGPIPAELGNLPNLKRLQLYDNQLSGSIPAELGNLANLKAIFIGGNQFSGCIPNGFLEVAEGDLSMLSMPYCGTIASDQAALVAFYNATDGPNWANSANWLTEAPLGDWQGVTTDATTGRVVGLDLAGNNLTGPIPAELGNLANLAAIFLGDNQFSGCIPNWFLDISEGDLSTLGLQYCGTISSDRAALVTLYNATDGPNWDSSSNWLTDAPLGDWRGVRTDANTGRVVGLELGWNQLTGPIPAELGNLANLERLWLSSNQLSGPIPAELGNLANLKELRLSSNQLSGPIPAELGNLANLKELRLYDNQLGGPIPAELGNLANLERLWLSSNQLSGPIPAELGILAKLESLYLYDNQLSGPIPAELGNLANLSYIYLRGNQFSGCIPNGLQDAWEFDFFHLGRPYCGTISSDRATLVDFYNSTDGENWTKSANWLTDAPLGDWQGVTTDATTGRVVGLDLAGNNLTRKIPAELGNLAKLEELRLHDNQLSGPIPTELGNLPNLKAIYLRGNQFSVCIPNRLQDVPEGDLSTLGLLECGTISTDRAALVAFYNATDGPNWANSANWLTDAPLGDWHGVTTAGLGRVAGLDLRSNKLTGPIPEELGNLPYLEEIYLRGNQFSGCIPNRLRDVRKRDLSMLGRPYCGTISIDRAALVAFYNATDGSNWTNSANWLTDAPLGDWQGVTTDATTGRVVGLDLAGNNLTGPIPHELGDLGNVLLVLDLSNNQLSGPIPAELGNLAYLEAIHLGGNQFSGCIPSGLQEVAVGDLPTLGLQDCGTIFTDRAALVALYNATDGANWDNSYNWLNDVPLEYWEGVRTDSRTGRVVGLDLAGNNLTGPIPAELGRLTSLERLWLNNNKLSGTIPAELSNLASLIWLRLDDNQLSGLIPAELGNLANLGTLLLSQNQLSGPIPAELGNLPNLYRLDLTENQLSGSVPAELGNLPNLTDIFLRGNSFSGCIPNGLRGVGDNDFSELGLPFCEDLEAPELVVFSPSVSDDSPSTGISFSLSATVRNQGGGESAATTLRYYRSTDATITPSDTEVGTDALGALAASGTSDQSIELTAPSTAGRYFYGACVDAVPNEFDTTNNCSSWVQVDVE